MNGLMSDGGPAFPGASPSTGTGLTVREYIAAHIMGHMTQVCCVAHIRDCEDEDDVLDTGSVARAAVQLADALMVELRK